MSFGALLFFLVLTFPASLWGTTLTVKEDSVGRSTVSFLQTGLLPDNGGEVGIIAGVVVNSTGILSLYAGSNSILMDHTAVGIHKLRLDADLRVNPTAPVTIGGLHPWVLIALDTFDESTGADKVKWSSHEESRCGSTPDVFLGGHCKLAAGVVSKAYQGLPAHSRIRLTARAHFLDEWRGESLYLRVDGTPVWSERYHWCTAFNTTACLGYGVNVCGQSRPDRLSVPIDVTVPHDRDGVEVVFGSTIDDSVDPCDASWGIDDVAVFVM
ncbi:unnamed protein product [Vitrella brassicaformis CCMP3155]|uniref:Uncharacterized protein n=2 Tax=Vitrella brassicaformis TaxID=1169539 RepID=A0A0G4G0B5_VITBC|nr:unnamed protein product [Vitrella brassicaformis CCMP3155]|eukprot:CEM20972.1 unnamed protein product [Vitrella brassicaformis CCMP3155]